MSWDNYYVIPWQDLDVQALEAATQRIAQRYAGTQPEVRVEGPGRATVFFEVPPAHLDPVDAEELARYQPVPTGDPVAFHFSVAHGEPSARKDVGRCLLTLHSTDSANGICALTSAMICDELARELGGVYDKPLPPRPDQLEGDGLADLRRMLTGSGEVAPAWRKAHAPDGDLDAAIARLWEKARADQLAPFLKALPVHKLIGLGLAAWKLTCAREAAAHPHLAQLAAALEAWLEGKSTLKELRPLAAQIAPLVDGAGGFDGASIEAARGLNSIVEAARMARSDPGEARWSLGVFFEHPGDYGPRLGELVRQWLKPPRFAALKKQLARQVGKTASKPPTS